MTPHEKWLTHMAQFGLPKVPNKTRGAERLFWRLLLGSRRLSSKGVSCFGMHYWSPELAGIGQVDLRTGKTIEFSIRFNPDDLSCIALFRDGNFVGDAFPKELRQADGSYQRLSEAQRELAHTLQINIGQPSRDWLKRINRADELSSKRKNEKAKALKKSRGKPSHSTHTPVAKIDTEIKHTSEQPYDSSYDDFLSGFTGKQ